jgi:hypothetical protein
VTLGLVNVAHQPAVLELGQWLRVGYTRRWDPDSAESRLSLGAGVNATFQVGVIGKEEVRLGPFVGVESPLDRFRGEGGLELALQRVNEMKDWASSALALGAGGDDRGVPHAVGTFAFGLRYVKARYSEYGCGHPKEPPAGFGLASSFRLFVTYRQELRDEPVRELSVGFDFGVPMLRRLAPPYTCRSRLP